MDPAVWPKPFVYVEQEPPLEGPARRKDYQRQFYRWRYYNKPGFRARRNAASKGAVYRQRAREKAARECGAAL